MLRVGFYFLLTVSVRLYHQLYLSLRTRRIYSGAIYTLDLDILVEDILPNFAYVTGTIDQRLHILWVCTSTSVHWCVFYDTTSSWLMQMQI